MNYKMLFIVMLMSVYLYGRSWEFELPAFSLEKSDTAVSVTVDTGKKVTADDISITHNGNRVSVDIKGLDHTLTLKLEVSKHTLGISMCSQTHQEKKNEQEFSVYQGSSCMQQMMSVGVDLAGITAEYSGTKLVLSIPLVKQQQGKKISVVMKEEIKEKKNKPLRHGSTSLTTSGDERVHEK